MKDYEFHKVMVDCTRNIDKLEHFLKNHFRLDERSAAIKKKKFYSMELELTKRCNLDCSYCYNVSSRKSVCPDLNTEEAKKIIAEAYEYDIRSVTFLGGEPTLHKDLCGILSYAKEIGMDEVVLYTNGTRMDTYFVEVLNECVDTVVLHLDSIDPNIFSQIHDLSVSESNYYFDSIFNNLMALKSSGYDSQKLRHCLTLFRPTFITLERTLKWAIKEQGMLTSIFIPLVRTGRGEYIEEDLLLDIDEIKEAYEIRADVESRPELLLLGPSEYCKQYQMSVVYIDSEGVVLPYAGYHKDEGYLISNNCIKSILEMNYDCLSFSQLDNDQNSCLMRDFCFGTQTSIHINGISSKECDKTCWIQ